MRLGNGMRFTRFVGFLIPEEREIDGNIVDLKVRKNEKKGIKRLVEVMDEIDEVERK
ncbi:hypothetical protein [Staphylococcus saprophyticus]|uniref:hypothetical protein n=1 Tax=Staphylococcus saprophyticus TaxID=29385 RepID=UPI001780DA74|nr:hypothetical protein [Staphylococcus saprophyticus]